MMTKFNVGDKVRITNTDGACLCGYQKGDIATVYSMNHDGTCTTRLKHDGNGIRGFGDYGIHFELVVDKPKKYARITALESQVATLQAKVEALEKAGQYPLTERFERESAAVDGILADIERKAKPTLEALLATYPTPNEQRADVIKRAKAFVDDSKRVPSYGGNPSYITDESPNYVCDVEFHVNNDKRTVVALLKWLFNGAVKAKGIAKCGPSDVFNADIGKAIALGRALGVDVMKFTKAVQPTACVGQRVELIHCGFITLFPCDVPEIDTQIGQRIAKITDDTDAVYE